MSTVVVVVVVEVEEEEEEEEEEGEEEEKRQGRGLAMEERKVRGEKRAVALLRQAIAHTCLAFDLMRVEIPVTTKRGRGTVFRSLGLHQACSTHS